MAYNSPNYFEQGTGKLVIGGNMEIKDLSKVSGLPTCPTVPEIPEIPVAANVPDCAAADVAGCVASINAILTALKEAGLMAALAGEGVV